jgi:hypothetical protein
MLFKVVQKEVGLQKITKRLLHNGIRVDFYIPEMNLIVEVNGVQHYQESSFGRDKIETAIQYANQLTRDDRLRTICSESDINIIEIPYHYSYSQILTELTRCKDEYSRD